MAVQSPNQYISGPSMWADVPDVPSQLLQGYQQLIQQQATPDEEELRKALALREQYMQERGNAAPTYTPGGAGLDYMQGSLASVPHTAGYAGPTRVSDLLFPQPIKLRTTEDNAPMPGFKDMNQGQVKEMAAAMKTLPSAAQQGALEKASPGIITDLLEKQAQIKQKHDPRNPLDTPGYRAVLQRQGEWVSKENGAPLSLDLSSPEGIPPLSSIYNNYVKLTESQRKQLGGVRSLQSQIERYKDVMSRLELPGEPGMASRGINSLDKWMQAMAGTPEMAELQALQAEIGPVISAMGQNTKTMDSNMERQKMEKAFPTAYINRKANDALIRNMERIVKLGAQGLPIRNPVGQSQTRGSGDTVRIRNPKTGEERDVPAEQADYYTGKGGVIVNGR